MKKIEVQTDNHISNILVGERIANLKNYLPSHNKVVIVTDANIMALYGNYLSNYPIIEIGLGESNKTIQTLDDIFSRLVELEADRSTFIVGVGGGIVCDVTGIAASLFMRGLKFGFVSTTLLSQVDASTGGKNGVNFQGFKNMIGVFNQPEFVICDIDMLKTLPENEFRSGFAEIIKAGAIKDSALFEYMEQNTQKALEMDTDVLEHLVYQSVKIKAEVVKADEREKGERRKLNFGHTFAHSIEKLHGGLHGEAVSIGMVLASKLSVQLGLLNKKDAERIKNLCSSMKLPVETGPDTKDLFGPMKRDKKREGNSIHMVLLSKIGDAQVKQVALNDLEKLVYDLHSHF
ncbi:MAG: 3-dehydroquinate synthase [Bacteroidales bacterium]|nr:3-dehydroquinate synthase [Bacteroidales bacterium]